MGRELGNGILVLLLFRAHSGSPGSGCLCVSKPYHQAPVPLESATQGALKIQFQNGEQVLRTFFTSAAWLVFVSVIDRETQTTEQPESDL